MRHEDLRFFLEVAETRNMRRAAENLGATQSALTKAIKRLESELHVRLFDRAPRGVELTEPGRAFHARVRTVDLHLTHALHELEHMRMGELGVVRLGSTAADFDTLIKPILSRLLNDRPQARFVLSLEISRRLIDMLLQGRLDLVVAGTPMTSIPELDQIPLHDESMHAVVRAGHPLLRSKSVVADLSGFGWLLPPPGRVIRRWVDERMHELSLPPARVALETDATLALLSPLLRESELIGVMTTRMLGSPAGSGIRTLDHLVGTGKGQLAVLWRRDSYLSPLVRDVRKALTRAGERGGERAGERAGRT